VPLGWTPAMIADSKVRTSTNSDEIVRATSLVAVSGE
jgi:hypothetical protein